MLENKKTKKFICGLGRAIYGIFGQKLLIKCKRLCNPNENYCNSLTMAKISTNGLNVQNNDSIYWMNVVGTKGFAIGNENSRLDNFPGTMIYYYEVLQKSLGEFYIGLSNGKIPYGSVVGDLVNSYGIPGTEEHFFYRFCGNDFEWPNDTIQFSWNSLENVIGCGLLLNPENEVSLFFTGNGIIIGKPIPISPTINCLYPTISIGNVSLEMNFGNNPYKPFKYDINQM